MLGKTRGIVFHSTPYNDKYSIVHMYTEQYGRVSYMVYRTKGKKSTASKALFMPFSIVEMEVEHLPKRDIHRIKEYNTCLPLCNLYCHPIKNTLVLFLSEILYRIIRESESDNRLFNFIYRSIHLLEHLEQGIANFHIVFLLELLHYLGIFPHTETYQTDYYFDMMNGRFTSDNRSNSHCLNLEESRFFERLLRINYENMSLYGFSRQDRVNILNRIIEYYRLHLPEFSEIKSLAIMQTLF